MFRKVLFSRFKFTSKSGFSNWTKSYLNLPINERKNIIVDEILNSNVNLDSGVKMVFSKTHGGFAIAMQMREDITSIISSLKDNVIQTKTNENKEFKAKLYNLDDCVKSWLGNVLCVDALQLKRVTFESSSGDILEKVARGESVHRVRSLAELKRRLHDGRRCFALFHYCLPEDPLVFVHIGLTTELSRSLASLDTHKNETNPVCAIFYSINSPHTAFSGLDLASQLIKEAVPALRSQYPSLETFSTLSPIPNFVEWLGKLASNMGSLTLPQQHADTLKFLAAEYGWKPDASGSIDVGSAVCWLHGVVSAPQPTWTTDATLCTQLKDVLLWLGARYIAHEKLKKGSGGGTLPLDPVARFHLRNGATFHRINWLANPSLQGLQTSAGMMANYKYSADLSECDRQAKLFEACPVPLSIGVEVERILHC